MIAPSGSDIFQFYTERKLATCLILLLLELFMEGAETSSSKTEVESHLELGRELLAKGQLSDALSHYHAAVEGDSSNYLTFFKRGTVYLALGKTRFALNDFSKVLELKPDFVAARVQRGTVHMKMGNFDEAEEDFIQILQDDPNNEDVRILYNRLNPAREQWRLIQNLIAENKYESAISFLTQLLELSPMSITFRKLRSECYIKDDDIMAAISDLRSVNKLSQDSTEGYYDLAVLLYKLGHATNSLKEIRECLKLDPEHKDCFSLYKKIKKVEKALTDAENYRDSNQFENCISSANIALKHEKTVDMIIFYAKQLLCTCYKKDEQYTQAIKYCSETLNIQKDAMTYCDRADSYIETEMFDEAILDYKSALDMDELLQRAKDGLEKAKRLQKQSEKRDYYKILGVRKNANKQEIVKAYRKMAQKWHPDNFKGDEKKIAEKKFIDIAAAKEVLTDPEKRRQFDQGEDPLDPEGGQNGFRNGNPFAHFQHGSPFQFKFHFN